MSCQSFLPVSLHQAEAEGLALTALSVGSPEGCEEHEASLSMFCVDDLEPLCEQCAAVSHAGHRVYFLTDAATDCKEELKTSLNKLKKKMTVCERVAQICDHATRHNEAEAKLTEEQMKKEFESLHQFLREEEAARLLTLREEQEEKKREAEGHIDRMNQVIQALEEKIHLVEEELDAGGDGLQFLEYYQDSMNSTWTGDREQLKVCRPLIDVAKHLGNLRYAEWEKMKHIAPYTPVTLDPRTAGQSLRVSPGLNSVHIRPGASQGLEQSLNSAALAPANPERFHPYSCILAKEGFNSGVHCWDIEVGDADNWTIGVAAQSLSRRTEFEACPEAGLWCISLREGVYQALTTPAQTLNSQHLSRVHVRLDWEAGTLGFMNADTDMHLFTFKDHFSEKVYPYFESLSLCGGFALLAQSVNVSLELDCVPVENDAITEKKTESFTEGDINSVSTEINSKMSEHGHPTEDLQKCSVREEKKTKPHRSTSKKQLSKTKPSGKEKTKDKKQSSKPRFSTAYHISLNKAQNISNKPLTPDDCGDQLTLHPVQ